MKTTTIHHLVIIALVPALFLVAASGTAWGGTNLLFHAGVGQRSSLNEVKTRFETVHPDITVNYSYKGSGYFIADITRSRQGDLFMPGEEFYVLQAVERGFVEDYDPRRDIAAYFVCVIITPRGNPADIHSIEDFARPGVRVGLGNPRACAVGIWHEKIFEKAGIWDKVQKNAVMSAKCIPELGNAVQHRAIDATIVWSTTAVLYLRDAEIIPLPHKYRGIVRLPVTLLTFARYKEEAEALKEFILSDEGKRIFHRHAYAVNDDIPVDEDGFCVDDTTDADMRFLINAAQAVKDIDYPVTEETVGDLTGEVLRQRKTRRAGN
jgi:molybdate transport system substrate-binding protein